MSEDIKSFNKKLFDVIQELESVVKDTKAYNYKYATLTSVLEELKPKLQKQGLFVTQKPCYENGLVGVTTTIHDSSSSSTDIFTSFSGCKDINDPQKVGSVITYLRRYALVAYFGLELEDDDGKKASEPKKEQPKKQEPIDYTICPIGKVKGKKFSDLDYDKLVAILEYYNGSNIKDKDKYLSIINKCIDKILASRITKAPEEAIQNLEEDEYVYDESEDNFDDIPTLQKALSETAEKHDVTMFDE